MQVYYGYLQDVGHHIDDCKVLRDFIRRLIADDYLQEYIAHHKRAQHNAPDDGHTCRDVPTSTRDSLSCHFKSLWPTQGLARTCKLLRMPIKLSIFFIVTLGFLQTPCPFTCKKPTFTRSLPPSTSFSQLLLVHIKTYLCEVIDAENVLFVTPFGTRKKSILARLLSLRTSCSQVLSVYAKLFFARSLSQIMFCLQLLSIHEKTILCKVVITEVIPFLFGKHKSLFMRSLPLKTPCS